MEHRAGTNDAGRRRRGEEGRGFLSVVRDPLSVARKA
jgi:hypothetical protein